jgi:hypothetical protein
MGEEKMSQRPKRRWYVDPFTACEIIYFYNPRIKQFIVMQRDIATKRFIRRLRELYICGVRSFSTQTPDGEWAYPRKKRQKDRSKNIWIECSQVGVITEDTWINFTKPEQFEYFIHRNAKVVISWCDKCWELFEKATAIPVHMPRVDAYIVTTQPCMEYCCYARPLHEYAKSPYETRIKCYDKRYCYKDELGRIYCEELYGEYPPELREEAYRAIMMRAIGMHALKDIASKGGEIVYDDAPTYEEEQ